MVSNRSKIIRIFFSLKKIFNINPLQIKTNITLNKMKGLTIKTNIKKIYLIKIKVSFLKLHL